MCFDDFLCATVVLKKGAAVREKDLFGAVKMYAQTVGTLSPTWPEFHRLLKERNAWKIRYDGMVLIVGVDWYEETRFRPVTADSYMIEVNGSFPHANTSIAENILIVETAVDDDRAPWE